uniref:Small ribosomal subunit protein mS26 n=1 Tax=Glossina brevipalpis TaxID=37001 RepID=A0A1A9X0Z4_9MUSC
MLRLHNILFQHLNVGNKTVGNSCVLEFVRWRRKPRWLPVAKSKMFRIPQHKPQSLEEKTELLRLHNNYRTQMRSLRRYLIEENQRIAETTTTDHFVLTAEQEEEEFHRCLQENEKWNKEINTIRELRLAKEREERKIYVEEKLQLAEERKEEHMQRIESLVRKEKELSKTFITREKLDEAIEYALANPVDYNFALDIQGNMYRGRTNIPTNAEPVKTIQQHSAVSP